jgi:hypothetical protein
VAAFGAAVSALVMAASTDQLVGLRHEPDCALEGKIRRPPAPVDLPRAEPELSERLPGGRPTARRWR